MGAEGYVTVSRDKKPKTKVKSISEPETFRECSTLHLSISTTPYPTPGVEWCRNLASSTLAGLPTS
jgi:hypothetical protein